MADGSVDGIDTSLDLPALTDYVIAQFAAFMYSPNKDRCHMLCDLAYQMFDLSERQYNGEGDVEPVIVQVMPHQPVSDTHLTLLDREPEQRDPAESIPPAQTKAKFEKCLDELSSLKRLLPAEKDDRVSNAIFARVVEIVTESLAGGSSMILEQWIYLNMRPLPIEGIGTDQVRLEVSGPEGFAEPVEVVIGPERVRVTITTRGETSQLVPFQRDAMKAEVKHKRGTLGIIYKGAMSSCSLDGLMHNSTIGNRLTLGTLTFEIRLTLREALDALPVRSRIPFIASPEALTSRCRAGTTVFQPATATTYRKG